MIVLLLGSRCLYRALNKNQFPIVESNGLTEQLKGFASLSDELAKFSEELAIEFEEFLRFHNKKYSSIKEHWRRFTIFAKNHKELQETQRKANNTFFDSMSYYCGNHFINFIYFSLIISRSTETFPNLRPILYNTMIRDDDNTNTFGY